MAIAAYTTLTLDLLAPLSGVMVPLEAVPDPVFAGRLAGDGIAIDPTSSELLAPCAGTVTQLHPAHHALALTTADGVEVLLHVGLDTVALKGEGFTPRVGLGDRVEAGQPLLAFDAALVGRRARSLLTLMVLPDGARLGSLRPAAGLVTAGRDAALRVEVLEPGAAAAPAAGATVLSPPVALRDPSGLHARPAALVAAEAKRFQAAVHLVRGADEVNAKSVVALLGLGAQLGERLQVKATGPDAGPAAAAVARLLGLPGTAPAAAPAAAKATAGAGELAGVAAAPGLAVGRILQHRPVALDVTEEGRDPALERTRLEGALREAGLQLGGLRDRLAGATEPARLEILAAHRELLTDPDLTGQAFEAIVAGKSAAFAWRAAFDGHAAALEALASPLLRERAGDLRDVGRRVLALLTGTRQEALATPPDTILVAEELTPSEAAQLDPAKVLGLCTTLGGPTGHVAILARSLGIPAVCGMDEAVLDLPAQALVVLDGTRGLLRLDPAPADLAQARERIGRQASVRSLERAAAHRPAVTADGVRVEVAANIRNARDAREAVAAGAEGVGLLRSEFLFQDRDVPPTEDEQAEEYGEVARALGPGRRLVVRTLDVGGDKPLAYLPLPREDNPFLGMRGLRVSLEQPALFRTQLRALLRAAPLGDLHIMFPMVSTLEELLQAKAILAAEALDLGRSAKVGVMIEVPSAVLIADALAREADFFSIGTNDLTQYCLAMDRGHPRLARQADALHPAVLKLIGLAVEAAHRHGRWVGVCGGLASDALALPVLLGLGVDELSVAVPAIGAIKARLARLHRAECVELARALLEAGTAAEVRLQLAPYAE